MRNRFNSGVHCVAISPIALRLCLTTRLDLAVLPFAFVYELLILHLREGVLRVGDPGVSVSKRLQVKGLVGKCLQF